MLMYLFNLVIFCLSVVAASSGGDFMSDLFNKLAMRRKGRTFIFYEQNSY